MQFKDKVFLKLFIVLSLILSLSAFSARIPKEFDLVEEHIGEGAYSQVHLLQLKGTSDYYVIKIPHDIADGNNRSNFYKHISLHAGWSLLGLTDVPMYYYERKSGKSVRKLYILQGYVEGPTLEKAYVEDGYRLRKNNPMTKALVDFINVFVRNRVFIDDVNAKNLIYDINKKRWQLIDSQKIKLYDKKFPTFEQAFGKLRSKFKKKWTEGNNHVGAKDFDRFFDDYEKNVLPKIVKENPKRVAGLEAYLKSYYGVQKMKDGSDYHKKVIPEVKDAYDWKQVSEKVVKGAHCKVLF